MDMVSAPPATLNAMLAKGELDISPVSSAAYARHQEDWLLLPGLSISCFGPVMSVILVSRFPLEDLSGETVVLTQESATAAALSRYLFASRRIRPNIRTGKVRCPADLPPDAAAALVIGDAALRENWAGDFDHVWDLGELWKEHTGLPFVFALWAVRKAYARQHPMQVSAVLEEFLRSKSLGAENLHRIVPLAGQKLGITNELCREYYHRLNYELSELQISGMQRFFDGLFRERVIEKPVTLSFFEDYRRVRQDRAA
jgi:chorismate dehydratase